MSDVVAKLWGFCHTLRHDGVDYGDYIEQLTYLLFLKMADERGITLASIQWQDEKGKHTTDCSWPTLTSKAGTALTDHYAEVLRILSRQPDLLGEIFTQATPRLSNPVNLKRLLVMIDEEDWSGMDVDVKGAAFEGLLEKAASEGKKGAGQYFTPRKVIEAICRVMKPDPRGHREFRIMDPACGTGGFLVTSYEWLIAESKGTFDRSEIKRLKTNTYFGQELVARPRRLALMNLYLHGVAPHIYLGDTIYQPDKGERYDIVLTNPPFGNKGANQAPEREDFTIQTSNKQLNFVQHVVNILKPGGRAAIVLPDNCLFADKAGEVFEIVMQDCRVHTILRLPRGTFNPYSPGVKANVIFLQKGEATGEIWIFDGRSNVPGITKKERPLTREHFSEFEKCYGADPNGRSKRRDQGEEGRFRRFSLDEIKKRNYNLLFPWLKDDTIEEDGDLPEPQDLATDAIAELEAIVDDLKDIVELLDKEEAVEK
jgi:type I restriction enzyme M protein